MRQENFINALSRVLSEENGIFSHSDDVPSQTARSPRGGGTMPVKSQPDTGEPTDDYGDQDEFSADDIDLGKQFLNMVGDPERAKAIIDRCVECGDCIGLSDEDRISDIASQVPDDIDGPTQISVEIDDMYDPDADVNRGGQY